MQVDSTHPDQTQTRNLLPRGEQLTRIFNTAILATRVETGRDYPKELYALVDSPAFRAILSSIETLARDQSISERTAAEHMIRTFRKMDQIWADYTLHEGIERLKGACPGPQSPTST